MVVVLHRLLFIHWVAMQRLYCAHFSLLFRWNSTMATIFNRHNLISFRFFFIFTLFIQFTFQHLTRTSFYAVFGIFHTSDWNLIKIGFMLVVMEFFFVCLRVVDVLTLFNFLHRVLYVFYFRFVIFFHFLYTISCKYSNSFSIFLLF